jgi:hypothetical protein
MHERAHRRHDPPAIALEQELALQHVEGRVLALVPVQRGATVGYIWVRIESHRQFVTTLDYVPHNRAQPICRHRSPCNSAVMCPHRARLPGVTERDMGGKVAQVSVQQEGRCLMPRHARLSCGCRITQLRMRHRRLVPGEPGPEESIEGVGCDHAVRSELGPRAAGSPRPHGRPRNKGTVKVPEHCARHAHHRTCRQDVGRDRIRSRGIDRMHTVTAAMCRIIRASR